MTLIELLITLAIVAILVVIGLPSLQEAIRTNRASSFSNDILAAAAYARSEAVRRSAEVAICASPDPTAGGSDAVAAAAACSGAALANGWIVFVDADGDGQRQAAEQVLRVGDVIDGLVATGSANSGAANFVLAYDRLGRAGLAAAETIDIRSDPCPAGGPARRLVAVSRIGRLTVDPTIRFCP